MFSSTPFTVMPEHLRQLAPDRAVEFFRRLLWAEGHRLGIGNDLINVPTRINDSDGGVDAEVENPSSTVGTGLIKPGLNCYQVKTGNFDASRTGEARSLLFIPASIRRRNLELQPRIKSCLDRHGRFVVVLFGMDNPNLAARASDRIGEELHAYDTRYDGVTIDVWQANQLIGWIEMFPALALRLNGLAGDTLQTHREWSSLAEMSRSYQAGEQQHREIREIQQLLRDASGPRHVRITGEPGIGKTRLALEATRIDDLQSGALYFAHPSGIQQSQLLSELTREHSELSAIVVVDECSQDQSARLWDRLRHASPRVRLVTIDVTEQKAGSDVDLIPASPLPEDDVARIISGYLRRPFDARRWARLCDGSPRVAHVVGENLQQFPDDLLREPSTSPVWSRFVAAGSSPESLETKQRLRVLRYLALFRRFGFDGQVADEGRAISGLITRTDPQITEFRFREIVQDLRRRKILQGERTLYITPKLFHIWLWAGWWETYGNGVELDQLLGQIPESLMLWFWEMFEYAAASQAATGIVRRLLSPSGMFEGQALLKDHFGPRLIRILAASDPGATLQLLERNIGTWSDDDLGGLTAGRSHIETALELIAETGAYFDRASVLLLRLAETDEGGDP